MNAFDRERIFATLNGFSLDHQLFSRKKTPSEFFITFFKALQYGVKKNFRPNFSLVYRFLGGLENKAVE